MIKYDVIYDGDYVGDVFETSIDNARCVAYSQLEPLDKEGHGLWDMDKLQVFGSEERNQKLFLDDKPPPIPQLDQIPQLKRCRDLMANMVYYGADFLFTATELDDIEQNQLIQLMIKIDSKMKTGINKGDASWL